MESPYSFDTKHDQNGRIIEKTETVAGKSVKWTYAYDDEGHLTEATLDGRTVCQCDYDREGRRMRDRLPLTSGNSFRNHTYRMDNRLMQAGDNRYTHDKNGFRSIWSHRESYTTYKYAPDHRLLEVHQEDDDIRFTYDHDENGQRMAKYRNGEMVEAYKWLDFLRLAGFYDGEHVYEFAYEEDVRTPYAMCRDDGSVAYLFYDQVGSLRVVAGTNGTVIKEILYDPFGMIIKDTNPSLTIPTGFAGGLHDRDINFVRFGWRDYDPNTARWTAPDPMGDAGGDKDWYGYCLDDPVNGNDPLGLAVALAPYALQAGLIGGYLAHDVYDTTYGVTDYAQDLAEMYGDYVKYSVRKSRKIRRDYYNKLQKQRDEEAKKAEKERKAEDEAEKMKRQSELDKALGVKTQKENEFRRATREDAREFKKRANENHGKQGNQYGGSSSNIGARGGSYGGNGNKNGNSGYGR